MEGLQRGNSNECMPHGVFVKIDNPSIGRSLGNMEMSSSRTNSADLDEIETAVPSLPAAARSLQ